MNTIVNRWWGLAVLLLPLAVAAGESVITLTDDRGVAVTFARPTQRIVSLLPSLTETVCALGSCDRLVGVDRYSDHPPKVRGLPKLGGGLDPDIEGVLALRPDVVLLAGSARAAERFEALGLKVLALEPRSSKDFDRSLTLLDQLLGTDRAPALRHEIDAGIAVAAARLPELKRAVRVYFEVSEGPYAAGPTSFIGEIMQRLGLVNIVPDALGPYPLLNPEFVVRADPDLLLLGEVRAAALAARPGWGSLRALRTGRVCTFAKADADILVRAGPRMAEAARLVAECVAAHPERTH